MDTRQSLLQPFLSHVSRFVCHTSALLYLSPYSPAPLQCDAERASSVLNRIVPIFGDCISWGNIGVRLIGAEDLNAEGSPCNEVARTRGGRRRQCSKSKANRKPALRKRGRQAILHCGEGGRGGKDRQSPAGQWCLGTACHAWPHHRKAIVCL